MRLSCSIALYLMRASFQSPIQMKTKKMFEFDEKKLVERVNVSWFKFLHSKGLFFNFIPELWVKCINCSRLSFSIYSHSVHEFSLNMSLFESQDIFIISIKSLLIIHKSLLLFNISFQNYSFSGLELSIEFIKFLVFCLLY